MSHFKQVRKIGQVLAGGALVALMGFTQVSFADDWVAEKLRGNVFAYNGTSWDKLERGSIVSDSRPIRTTRSGRAEFTREKETITIGGDTEISIFDRVGQRYTVVSQKSGKVAIEAERRNVQHFSVRTPFLAAVVKGTKFTVKVENGQAQIDVSRGTVSAQDRARGLKADVTPGQSASAGETASLHVSGEGEIAPVTDLAGNEVSASVAANGVGNSGNGNEKGDNGNSGSGNNGNGKGNSGSGNATEKGDNGNSGSGNNGNSGNKGHGKDKSADDDD